MAAKINYTAVGAFVVILSTVMIFIAFWLSYGFENKKYNTYIAYMEESVAGLSIKSPVKYNGVNVGFVRSLRINLANPKQVILKLDIEDTIPITEDTSATLATQGLTGISYIDLQGGSNHAEPLQVKPDEKYPVIQTKPSLLKRFDTTLQNMALSLTDVAGQLNSLIKENHMAFTETMKNTSEASKQLPELITSLDHTAATFNQTLPQAIEAFHSINDASVQLKALAQDLQDNPSMLIRGRAPQTLGPGETGK